MTVVTVFTGRPSLRPGLNTHWETASLARSSSPNPMGRRRRCAWGAALVDNDFQDGGALDQGPAGLGSVIGRDFVNDPRRDHAWAGAVNLRVIVGGRGAHNPGGEEKKRGRSEETEPHAW